MKTSDEFKVGKYNIGYISDDFKNYTKDLSLIEKPLGTLQKLPKTMTSDEMVSDLGVGISDLGDVLAFLKNPSEGTKDGNWNLFIFDTFVVGLFWGSYYGGWHVDAFSREGEWGGSYQVFSPATVPSVPCTLCPSCSQNSRITALENWKKEVEKIIKVPQ